ncbi:hypothetical protein [Bradyrhizobium sp. Gha]|uniref:hypothetical protein n=1 Tax=Bradyrhizobium sp. Gha TaxID=1855318 RepID=UPI0008EABC21|nr:hypothetical protein [Bradyrhizobium sp. Gha]SFK21106.1 hypothetical protein SAMN05216525_1642 [Bradyrhizobium sp. Gha]
MDRNAEVRRLNEADGHIAKAELALTKQLLVVDKLKADGHDTTEAKKQLQDFEDTLATLREHRGLIVDMIAQIDAGLA